MAYNTIKNNLATTIYEKKSEFIAHIAHVKTEKEAIEFLNSIRKKHHTANHNCYAYIIKDENIQRQSDDGEPSKTAGIPILEIIRHACLEDVIIVVTRYFGGTLLGTGGLVRAYTKAAKQIVEESEILSFSLCLDFTLEIDYSLFDKVKVILENNNAKILSTDFTHVVNINFRMLKGEEETCLNEISYVTKGRIECLKGEILDVF